MIEQERDTQGERLQTLAGTGDGELTDVERAEVDRLKEDIERLSADAVRARFIEGMATRSAEQGGGDGGVASGALEGRSGSDLPLDDRPDYTAAKRAFSPLKALGREMGFRRDAGLEEEVMSEMRHRDGVEYQGVPVPREAIATRADVSTSTATGGGLVMTEHRAQNFIEVLRNGLVLSRVGATVLDGLEGNVTIPGQMTAATAGWAAEGAGVSQSDPVFLSKAMSAKKVGMYTELTREVIRQANPDVEMLVMADFAAGIARAMDGAALVGGGSNEPSGVGSGTALSRSGTTTDGLALSRGDVLEMMISVDEDDVPEDSRAFVINARTAGKLFTVPAGTLTADDAYGSPALLDPHAPRDRGVMFGERVVRSNRVRATLTKGSGLKLSEMFYGNWSGLFVGYWGGLDLLPNPYESSAYKAGNVLVRALLNADLVIRNVKEFAFYNDLITTI